MKKILLFLMLFFSLAAVGQVPLGQGYQKSSLKYTYRAFGVDSGFHVPYYLGAPTDRVGVWGGSGNIGVDRSNSRFYFKNAGSWIRLAKYSEVTTPTWQQTLTAGSTLTGDNTIAGGGFDFTMNNIGLHTIVTNTGFDYYLGATPRFQIGGSGSSINSPNGATYFQATNGNLNFFSTGTPGTETSAPIYAALNSLTSGNGIDMRSSSLTSGSMLNITGTSTALAAGNEGLNIGISGANATNGITATGARISVTNTNATSGTNVGLDLTSSGAPTQNIALNVAAGDVLIAGMGNFADTTNFKPVVINTTGTAGTSNKLYKATYWPAGGGGGGWSLTGNAGTNPATNFIGTTDGQPLMFRYNNQNAGSIGKEGMHTYLGIEAGENDVSGGDPNIGIGSYVLSSNTTGDGNSAVGGFVLGNNTAGYYNSAVGVSALYSNTTGYYNLAVGISALGSNTTGYYNSAVGKSAGWNINQKPDAKYQNLFGANTYGTRDSISVIGANFIKETIVRGKLIDSTLSAGAGTKAVRWNSSTGEFTYADTTVGGGGTPAGSNKELQFNNGGSFGATTGIKYGNSANERLTLWQQTSSDVPLTIKVAGDNAKTAIEIKDTTGQPYTSAIKFTPSAAGSPQPSKIYQGYEGLYLDGGTAPYTTAEGSTIILGNSTGGLAPFKVHSYPYGVPASPNNWVAKIRTTQTSSVGLAIDWGAVGQTGDLLQFRNNSAAVLASVTSAGNIKAPAPTYSSGGYKFLVRNSTSSQFESIDPLVGSSTYTPTTSGLTNVDSTHVFECQYSWITDATTGLKTVTVSGQVEVYINSANTDSRVILSLPVASSFANEYEAGGSGGVTSASNGLSNHRYSIGVKANTISEAAEFVFNPTSGSCNAKINFSFHYKVNPS